MTLPATAHLRSDLRPKRAVSVAALLILAVLCPATLHAQEAEISPENEPYFVALLQIGLRKEQVPRFQELVGQYAADRQDAIDRALRSSQANLESRIRRARSKLEKALFKDMKRLLDEDQFSRFPPFHEELDSMLLERESLTQDIDEEGVFPNQT